LENDALLDFEESVEDNGYLLVEFERLPRITQEEAKKKRIPLDEIKPYLAYGHVDTSELMQPGVNCTKVRCRI